MKNLRIINRLMAAGALCLSAMTAAGCTVRAVPSPGVAAASANSILSGTKSASGITGLSEQTNQTTTSAAEETTTAASVRKISSIEITDDILAADTTSYDTGARADDRDTSNVPNGYRYYMTNWGTSYNASWLGDTAQNIIYLTFDCTGPEANVPAILSTLKDTGVKATFFVTQDFVDEQPQLVQQIIDDGHTLGNGSVSYPSAGEPSLSPEEQVQDIMPLEDSVYNTYNYEMQYFRFPNGRFSDQSLLIAQKMGFRSIFWSFTYTDTEASAAEALQTMEQEIHPGEIMRLGVRSDGVSGALAEYIQYAHDQGFKFAVFGSDDRY
ncbi:MAG: polysaccharide deacetylase family protein [Lachnospiraceae bacterium]|nr:polysaccharide deacetylase family protein [Lachnospiraceae bacterium]